MFSVNCNNLYEISNDWRTAHTSLQSCTDELTAIRRDVNIASNSSESTCHLLNSCLTELDECLNQWSYLSQALDRASELYSECENQILDYSEGAQIVYPQQEPTIIDLSGTEEILKEFSFIFKE